MSKERTIAPTEIDILDAERAELSAWVQCEGGCDFTAPAYMMICDQGAWLCGDCFADMMADALDYEETRAGL